MPSIQPFTDLNRIFDDSHSFTYDMPNCGVQNVTISTHIIGELVLTSGTLLPWDLLMIPDYRYCLQRTVAPGNYPVVLSVANFNPAADTRVAAAAVKLNNAIPVRWEPALVKEPNPDDSDRFSYGVDSGTGSFMDTDVARILARLFWEKSGETSAFEQFCDRVISEMDKNSLGKHQTAGWANTIVNQDGGANVITFSSGWGDGAYASFWGFDKSGDVACLATDFALF
jgi:hypothetical protein